MWMRSCAVCKTLLMKLKVNRLCPMSMRMGVVILEGLRLGLSSKK